jgi:hypothetical protein
MYFLADSSVFDYAEGGSSFYKIIILWYILWRRHMDCTQVADLIAHLVVYYSLIFHKIQ